MRQDSAMRPVVVLVALVGVLSAACDEEPTEATAVRTETRTTTVTETVTETAAQEPSGVCLDPGAVRRGLLADVFTSTVAYYVDTAEVEVDDICCGPGYLIEFTDEFGAHFVFAEGLPAGRYAAGDPEDVHGADDATFTPGRQFIKFSEYAARECLFTADADH
jgi:hypothetical protein